MSIEFKKRFGHVSKCKGIPMFPDKFDIDMKRPDSVSDEDIQKWDESFEKFMEKIESNFNYD